MEPRGSIESAESISHPFFEKLIVTKLVKKFPAFYTGWFKIIVGVSVAYNFQTRKNKIKLLMEYESVTRKVLISLESILQNAKQLHHARLSWHVRCPSGIQFPCKCSPAFAV
jgi:hypothetical protein